MAIKFRVKCPHCGEVLNILGDQPCPKCQGPLTTASQGAIQIYRMGNPFGIAVGYGIYINGVPYGHIGNKENLCVLLPFGTYTVHFTQGMNRRCVDATVTVSPQFPMAYVKGSIKVGVWTNKLIATVCNREDMPPLQ